MTQLTLSTLSALNSFVESQPESDSNRYFVQLSEAAGQFVGNYYENYQSLDTLDAAAETIILLMLVIKPSEEELTPTRVSSPARLSSLVLDQNDVAPAICILMGMVAESLSKNSSNIPLDELISVYIQVVTYQLNPAALDTLIAYKLKHRLMDTSTSLGPEN